MQVFYNQKHIRLGKSESRKHPKAPREAKHKLPVSRVPKRRLWASAGGCAWEAALHSSHDGEELLLQMNFLTDSGWRVGRKRFSLFRKTDWVSPGLVIELHSFFFWPATHRSPYDSQHDSGSEFIFVRHWLKCVSPPGILPKGKNYTDQ